MFVKSFTSSNYCSGTKARISFSWCAGEELYDFDSSWLIRIQLLSHCCCGRKGARISCSSRAVHCKLLTSLLFGIGTTPSNIIFLFCLTTSTRSLKASDFDRIKRAKIPFNETVIKFQSNVSNWIWKDIYMRLGIYTNMKKKFRTCKWND